MYPSGTGSSLRIRICILAFFASDGGEAGDAGEALGGRLLLQLMLIFELRPMIGSPPEGGSGGSRDVGVVGVTANDTGLGEVPLIPGGGGSTPCGNTLPGGDPPNIIPA